jgi:hypothetical protein
VIVREYAYTNVVHVYVRLMHVCVRYNIQPIQYTPFCILGGWAYGTGQQRERLFPVVSTTHRGNQYVGCGVSTHSFILCYTRTLFMYSYICTSFTTDTSHTLHTHTHIHTSLQQVLDSFLSSASAGGHSARGNGRRYDDDGPEQSLRGSSEAVWA